MMKVCEERDSLIKFEERLSSTVSADTLIPLISQEPELSLRPIMKKLKALFCPSAEESDQHTPDYIDYDYYD